MSGSFRRMYDQLLRITFDLCVLEKVLLLVVTFDLTYSVTY